MNIESRLHGTWQNYLKAELQLDYLRSLSDFLEQEERDGAVVYTPRELNF
jgi:uracil DNA glycosylase